MQPPFQCYVCYAGFWTWDAYLSHMAVHVALGAI